MLGAIKSRLGRAWEALAVGGRAVHCTDGRTARYERELLPALENPNVLNIALTGSCGAGKSSVLNTFFCNHPLSHKSGTRPVYATWSVYETRGDSQCIYEDWES